MKMLRICVRVNEWSNTHYFETFEIINELPHIGEEFGSYNEEEKVTGIKEVYPDAENHQSWIGEYGYFNVYTEKPCEDEPDGIERNCYGVAVALDIEIEEI